MEKRFIKKDILQQIFKLNIDLDSYIKQIYSYKNGKWLMPNSVDIDTFRNTGKIISTEDNSSSQYITEIKELYEKKILNEVYDKQPGLKEATEHIWKDLHKEQYAYIYLAEKLGSFIEEKNILNKLFTCYLYFPSTIDREYIITSYLVGYIDTTPQIFDFFCEKLVQKKDSTIRNVFFNTWSSFKDKYKNKISTDELFKICCTSSVENKSISLKVLTIIGDLNNTDTKLIMGHQQEIKKLFSKYQYDLRIQKKINKIFGESGYKNIFSQASIEENKIIKIEMDYQKFFLQAEYLGLKKSQHENIGKFFNSMFLADTNGYICDSYHNDNYTAYKYSYLFEKDKNLDEFYSLIETFNKKLELLEKSIIGTNSAIKELNLLNEVDTEKYLRENLNKFALYKKIDSELEKKQNSNQCIKI